MTKANIYEKLTEIFRDIFDDDTIELQETTSSEDIDGWDSLEHINIVVAVEQTFSIKFTMDEVTGMKNIGEMVDIIMSKL
jgi:acyl carrier protein|nr:acyl carrier protein [uncultured Marvinbryantia sp.]